MTRTTTSAFLTTVGIGLLMQGCVLTRETTDLDEQQAALDRWNRCLARFDVNVEHFCDGHRRDVLATYPAHMANHVNTLLAQQTRSKRLSRVMKTGLDHTAGTGDERVSDTLFQPQSEAR